MLVRRIARPLLAAVFIAEGVETLRNTKESASAAQPLLEKGRQALPDGVSAQLPADDETLMRINAGVQIGGGALFALGKAPRFAAVALAATLVPANIGQHAFWAESDPHRKAQQRKEFLGDLGLLGGLMLAAVDTEGKPSFGWRGRRAAQRASAAVAGALPIAASTDHAVGERLSRGLHAVAERGRVVADVAKERGPELAHAARERGAEVAEVVRERAPEIAEAARERGAEVAEVVRERAPEIAEAARARGAEAAEVVKDRAPGYAEAARERSGHLVDVAKDRTARYRS